MGEKKLPTTVEMIRAIIEVPHPDISIRRQCELIGLNRESFYAQPSRETALNLQLMRLIDEQYLKTPFYGYPRMAAHLRRAGWTVNPKRAARLMQTMGLQGLFPQRDTRFTRSICRWLLAAVSHRV